MESFFEGVTESPEETRELGVRLAGMLRPGDIAALTGNLGSGKTVLIQGVCAGLGVAGPVTSPTFTIVQEYKGRFPVFHFDFYRLRSPAEIEDLGLEDYFEREGVSLIEWSERGRNLIPEGVLRIHLERVRDENGPRENERLVQITDPLNRPLKKALA